MQKASPGRLWAILAAITGLVVAGQLAWMTLLWNTSGTIEGPDYSSRSPVKESPAATVAAGSGGSVGTRRKLYNAFPPLVDFVVEPAEVEGPRSTTVSSFWASRSAASRGPIR